MALILADDYKQWSGNGQLSLAGPTASFQGLTANASAYRSRTEALGYFAPGSHGSGGGAGTYWGATFKYDSSKNAAVVMAQTNVGSLALVPGASGMRRKISYAGDTLYVGISFEFTDDSTPTGSFLYFGSNVTSPSEFTATDGLLASKFSHVIGVNADGMFTVNGESVDVKAYYPPSTLKFLMDVVFTPNTVELWINNVRAYQKTRPAQQIKEMALTAQQIGGVNFGIWLHSLAVADNSPGFGRRFGRLVPRTEPAVTATTIESDVLGSSTAIQLIKKYAEDSTAVTGAAMLGSLSSPAFGVKNEFTGNRNNSQKPVAAAVMLQTKRLEPSSDGLAPLPYMTIAGTKFYGQKQVPKSTWKELTFEIPITPDQDITAYSFGYEHDYKDPNRVYVVDRANTEVYGSPEYLMGDWWKADDLVAYDSSVFNAAGFNDLNGKQIISASRVANTLPFLATENFKYGSGINLNSTGALLASVAQGDIMTLPWTIDFWFKESADNLLTAWQFYCYQAVVNNYLMICPDNPDTTKMAIWNQLSSVRARGTWNVWRSSVAWRHSATVYDGSKLSFYIDGVLYGTIDWVIQSFTKPFGVSHRGYWGYDVTASRIIIERYRMRSGARFTDNFNPDSIYG